MATRQYITTTRKRLKRHTAMAENLIVDAKSFRVIQDEFIERGIDEDNELILNPDFLIYKGLNTLLEPFYLGIALRFLNRMDNGEVDNELETMLDIMQAAYESIGEQW